MTKPPGNSYYRIMAILMSVLAVGGFTMFDVIHVEKLPIPYPILVFHAGTMVAWYMLFIIQTQLIGSGNYIKHKQLGFLSLFLSVAIVVFGIWVTYISYNRGADLIITSLNFGSLLNFGIAYSLGYLFRRKLDYHKRAMFLAGVAILAPALARIAITFQLPEPVTFLFMSIIIGTLIIQDIKVSKYPHKLSLILGFTLIGIMFGSLLLGTTENWANFLTGIWG